jgi:hypothetical protein
MTDIGERECKIGKTMQGSDVNKKGRSLSSFFLFQPGVMTLHGTLWREADLQKR